MAEISKARKQQIVQEMESLLPEVEQRFGHLPGVIGITVGVKEVKGLATQRLVFQLYVEKKKKMGDLPDNERIPESILGFPTDVIVLKPPKPKGEVVSGGMQISQSMWGASGTLGAIVTATAANTNVAAGTRLFLTNNHVAPTNRDLVGRGSVCDCWCFECCDIGRVVDSQLTNQVDAAIAVPNSDIRLSNEILVIGPIRGTATVTNANSGNPVFKYGNTTGYTEGRISTTTAPQFTRTDGATFNNQIRIIPATAGVPFSRGGDSGSVVVDANNRVIGLLHAGSDTEDFLNHIVPVMNLLNINFEVSGTTNSIPLSDSVGREAEAGFSALETFNTFREELEQSEKGQQWVKLFFQHREEIRQLVNHDRATTLAWHRYQGPAFLSHYLKSAKEPDYQVPEEINGIRMENLLIAMGASLQQRGSSALAAAISEHHLLAFHVFEHCRSLPELIDRAKHLSREDSIQGPVTDKTTLTTGGKTDVE